MPKLSFVLEVDEKQLKAGLADAQTQIKATSAAITKSGQSVDGFFTKIGRNFDNMKNNLVSGFNSIVMSAAGFSAAMKGGQFLSDMVSGVRDFNVAMKEVSTISDDVTNDMEGYKNQLLDLTARVPIGATEAAKALYQIVSAGQQGGDAMHVLEVSAKAAIGGVTDTATAADTLTTLMNAYHKSAGDAEHISDMLFTTVKNGKTTMSELGASIAQAAPTAAAYGVSMEDLLAAVATLTKQGVPTAMAMTQINAAITQGVAVLGDGAFQGRTFAEALQLISDKASGSMTALKDDVSNIRAMKAVLSMTGDSAKTAAKDLADMGNAAGAANKAFDKMADTKAMQRLMNDIQKTVTPLISEVQNLGKGVATSLAEGLETGHIEDYVTAIEGLVAVYGVYRTAVITTTALEAARKVGVGALTITENLHYAALVIEEKAQALLNKTMLANPYVAAAVAVASLAAGIYYLATRTDDATLAQEEATRQADDFTQELNNTSAAVDSYVESAIKAAEAGNNQAEAIEILKAKYPGIFEKYEIEKGHLRDIIALRKEIYELETGKTFQEKANLYQSYADAWKNHDSDKISEANSEYRKMTGRWIYTGVDVSEYFSELAKQARANDARAKTQTRVKAVQNSIQDASEKDIQKLTTTLSAGYSSLRGKSKAVKLNLFGQEDFYTREDINALFNTINGRSKTTTPTKTTTTTGTGTGKGGKTKVNQEAQDAQKLADVEARQKLEAQKEEFEQAMAYKQAIIDIKPEGREKDLAQAEYDYNKKILEIEQERNELMTKREADARELWEAQNAAAVRKGSTWANSGAQAEFQKNFALTPEDEAYLKAKGDAAVEALHKTTQKYVDEDNDAMRAYLKLYGSYAQKIEATNAEYQDKMKKAQSLGEKNTIQKEWDDAIAAINFDDFKTNLNWDEIFGDLSAVSTEYLAEIRKALVKLRKEGKLTIDQFKDITDRLKVVDDEALARDTNWLDYVGDIGALIKQRIKYTRELAKAQDALADAEKLVTETTEAANQAESDLSQTLQANNVDINAFKGQDGTIDFSKMQTAIADMFGKDSDVSKAIADKINTLQVAQGQQASASSAASGMSAGIAAKFGGNGNGANLAILDRIIHGINDNVQSLDFTFKELGGDIKSNLGQKISTFQQSSQYATNGWESLKKGDIVGLVGNVVAANKLLGKTLGIWSLGNIEEMQEKIDNLTASNENLANVMEDLKEAITEGLVSDAQTNYEDARALLEAQAENSRQIMIDESHKWESGSRSIAGLLARDTKAREETFATFGNDDYVSWETLMERASATLEKTIKTSGDFLSLSAEEMKTLRDADPNLFNDILQKYRDFENEHTGSGIDEMINDYIDEYADAFDDLEDMLNEKLTTTTFDDVFDNFKDLLKSMETTGEDWADNFEDMLRNAVINGLSDSFNESLSEWYEQFAEAMKDDNQIDAAEKQALQDSYNAIVDQAEAARDAIYDTLGIKDSSGSASATTNAVESVSEDTASDIVGRMTAIQIAQEKGREYTASIAEGVARLVGMLDFSTITNDTLTEIRNLQITANSYLEDVVKYAKASYSLMDDKLTKIETNTANI